MVSSILFLLVLHLSVCCATELNQTSLEDMRSFLDKIFEFRNALEESPRDTSIETHLVIAFVPSPQLPYSPDLSMLHSQLGEKIIEIIHKFQNYPKVLSLLAFFFLPVSPLEIQSGPTFTVLRIPWCLLDGIFDGIEVCNENENPIDVKVSRVFESTNKKRFHLSSRVIEAFYHSHWVHVGANKAVVYEERVPEVIEFELTGKKSRTFNPFANEKSRRDKKEILIPWESLAFLTKLGSLFSWFEVCRRKKKRKETLVCVDLLFSFVFNYSFLFLCPTVI